MTAPSPRRKTIGFLAIAITMVGVGIWVAARNDSQLLSRAYRTTQQNTLPRFEQARAQTLPSMPLLGWITRITEDELEIRVEGGSWGEAEYVVAAVDKQTTYVEVRVPSVITAADREFATAGKGNLVTLSAGAASGLRLGQLVTLLVPAAARGEKRVYPSRVEYQVVTSHYAPTL